VCVCVCVLIYRLIICSYRSLELDLGPLYLDPFDLYLAADACLRACRRHHDEATKE